MTVDSPPSGPIAEIVREGASRIAPLLEELVGRRIDGSVLDVTFARSSHLVRDLSARGREDGAGVLQAFDGATEGLALLWLPRAESLALTARLTGGDAPAAEHDFATESLLAELGSLVIGAVVGRLAEACRVRPVFDVPTVVLDPYPEDLEREFDRAGVVAQHMVVVQLQLTIDDAEAVAILALGFAADTLSRLADAPATAGEDAR